MGDYLEDLVAGRVTAHVSDACSRLGLAAPEFASVLSYFPLSPIAGGRMRYAAWPLVDGQVTDTQPLRVTTTGFSTSYARFLGTTLLQGGSSQTRLDLAHQQVTARKHVIASDPANGGLCLKPHDRTAAPCGYVPGYSALWHTDPGIAGLSIDIDVWRRNRTAPWQPTKGLGTGQRLSAKLTYSGFRLVILTPAPLANGIGWYSAAMMDGVRKGHLHGVSFLRQGGFGGTAGFQRAKAYILVGRVQFQKHSASSVSFPDLAEPAPPRPLLRSGPETRPLLRSGPKTRASPTAERLKLAEGLVLPFGRVLRPKGLRGSHAMDTSWDSGDLYALTKAGFIVSAVRDAPLAAD